MLVFCIPHYYFPKLCQPLVSSETHYILLSDFYCVLGLSGWVRCPRYITWTTTTPTATFSGSLTGARKCLARATSRCKMDITFLEWTLSTLHFCCDHLGCPSTWIKKFDVFTTLHFNRQPPSLEIYKNYFGTIKHALTALFLVHRYVIWTSYLSKVYSSCIVNLKLFYLVRNPIII